MDHTKARILSVDEVMQALGSTDPELTPIAIERDYHKHLKTNLLIPSVNQNFSCAVEFMTGWFYNKFPDNFFKTKYIEASNILQQAVKWRKKDFLAIAKPAAAIRANMDLSFSREQLDQYNYGTLMYNNRARYTDAFFMEREKHLFISMCMEILLINFTFRIMVPYQGLQHDIAKQCQMAFRANATQKHYVDVDFHVPDELLEQLAADVGLESVCPLSGKITDAIEFCHYFNQRSKLALRFKFNSGTGTYQYFLKVPNCIIHIRTNEIQQDEGMREGHIMNSYTVSFDCQVRFPAPKFYAYYSFRQFEMIRSMTKLDEHSFIVANTCLAKIPAKNDKGWQWLTRTDYDFDKEEEKEIKAGKLMHIDFRELIGDLRDVIDMTKSMALSPDSFLEIKVYSGYKFVSTRIDWQQYRINMLEPILSSHCYLVIYMDTEYYHDALENYNEYSKYRIQMSDTNIEHKRLDYKQNLKRASLGRDKDKITDTNVYLTKNSTTDNKPDKTYPDGCLYYENLKKNSDK